MTTQKLGIWMDHLNAHLTEISIDPVQTKTIISEFTHQQKADSNDKSESLMHNKEQHREHSYYKKLGEIIRNYQDVVLFGPTDAKTELLNLLRKDHHFDKIIIEVKQTDRMTENQEHAFVRNYFVNR